MLLLFILNACIAMVYNVYDVMLNIDDSRRYTNATNTSTIDIMKEMVLY